MPRAQAPANAPCLPVDIACLVASEEQRHTRYLVRHRTPPHRIQLPDFAVGAARPRGIEQRGCHAGFDQAGANGVAADRGAGELVADGLH